MLKTFPKATSNPSIEEQGEDEEDTPNIQKKQSRHISTLASDVKTINFKQLEVEYAVDPLFKKTCADFDEGGSKGLLMNHLAISKYGSVVFDAGEAEKESADCSIDPCETILADDSLLACIPSLDNLSTLEICPSLAKFDFSWESNDIPLIDLDLFDAPEAIMKEAEEQFEEIAYQEAFQEQNYQPPGFEEDMDTDNIPLDGVDENDRMFEAIDMDGGNTIGRLMGSERLTGDRAQITSKSGRVFSYFDPGMAQDWSGQERWKLRPLFKGKNCHLQT